MGVKRSCYCLVHIVRRVRKSAKSALSCHVCPSVRMEQLGSHWTDFHESLYLRIFRKSIEKIQDH